MPKKSARQDEIKTPKGMHDIIGDDFYLYQGFFERAQEIAVYYGFKPLETPMLEPEALFVRGVGENTDVVEKEMYHLKTKGGHKLVLRPEGTAPAVRAYIEHGMNSLPQPVLFYYGGPYFRHEKPQQGRLRQFVQFGLEVLGTQKSIADALIIKTTIDILAEIGLHDVCVEINSIGDSACRPEYTKELATYYKKHAEKLCANCRKRLQNNPLRLLDCKNEDCQELKEEAPDSVSFLCAACKKHFKEVLEYLDALDVSYRIEKTIMRGFDYYTRTAFEVVEGVTEEECEGDEPIPTQVENSRILSIAGGGRYDNLAKEIGSKKPVPGVGVGIGVDRLIRLPKAKSLAPRIIKKPKVYFIQLGFEAKLKSLAIIETLRQARIPIAQSLSKDTLATQLGNAEKMGVPYAIIFGQKEAQDGTVIIRNMKNRSQDTVEIEKLATYIKKMK